MLCLSKGSGWVSQARLLGQHCSIIYLLVQFLALAASVTNHDMNSTRCTSSIIVSAQTSEVHDHTASVADAKPASCRRIDARLKCGNKSKNSRSVMLNTHSMFWLWCVGASLEARLNIHIEV